MKKRNKSGQLSYFVLVGMVILIIFSVFFYINSEKTKTPEIQQISEFTLDVEPIKNYIDSAIKKTAEDGIIFISKNGGYYNLNEPFMRYGRESTAYYYYEYVPIVPSLLKIENELAIYIDDHLPSYLNNFSIFREQGFDITGDDLKTTVTISKEKTTIDLKYNLNIERDWTKVDITEFKITLPYNLKKIHDLAEEFISTLDFNSNAICISCLNDLSIKYDVSSSMYDIGDPDILFVLLDNNTIINSKPLEFSFGIRLPITKDSSIKQFKINEIENQETFIGYSFSYKVTANDEVDMFFDNSPFFDINKETGLINFSPNEDQVGTHLIKIDAVDKNGNTDSELFQFKIDSFSYKLNIENIGYLVAEVGKSFEYQVKVANEQNKSLFYLDDTDLFDISQNTGLIHFIPTAQHIGSHNINITVLDDKGGRDKEEFNLRIIS